LVRERSREVMTAAEVVLLASGTATLEAMLLGRPMVAAYRVAPVTAWIARRLVTVSHFTLPNLLADFTLPNLLAGRSVIPEFFQGAATAANLGPAVLRWLDDAPARTELEAVFDRLHAELRRDASQKAAGAIAELLERKRA